MNGSGLIEVRLTPSLRSAPIVIILSFEVSSSERLRDRERIEADSLLIVTDTMSCSAGNRTVIVSSPNRTLLTSYTLIRPVVRSIAIPAGAIEYIHPLTSSSLVPSDRSALTTIRPSSHTPVSSICLNVIFLVNTGDSTGVW